MVTVRNDELLISHSLLNRMHAVGLRNRPEAMNHAILVGKLACGRNGGFSFGEYRVNAFLRIRIKHKQLTGVCPSMSQEFEAVGFRSGKRVLVAKDDTGRIFLKPSSTDEATASASFRRTGDGELLRISVERGRGILNNNVIANPFLDFRRSPCVDVVLWRIFSKDAAFLNRDQVLRMHGVVFGLALR